MPLFHCRLAIPLWAMMFITVALTAPPPALFLMPPATLFLIAAVGIATIVFSMPGAIPWLGTSGTLVRVRPAGHRAHATAAVLVAAGTCVRTLDEPNRSKPGDPLHLVRMDDGGTWQMACPPLATRSAS